MNSSKPLAELKHDPEFVDSIGRTVIAYRQPHCTDYSDAWREYCRSLDIPSIARQTTRALAESALRCPEECYASLSTMCEVAYKAATEPKGWTKTPGSPYTPFLWRKYDIGQYQYDLVVYRRPKRSLLCKLLSCGG